MVQLIMARAMNMPKKRPSGERGNFSKKFFDLESGLNIGSLMPKQYSYENNIAMILFISENFACS